MSFPLCVTPVNVTLPSSSMQVHKAGSHLRQSIAAVSLFHFGAPAQYINLRAAASQQGCLWYLNPQAESYHVTTVRGVIPCAPFRLCDR